jgi:hypothetical protein
VQRDDRSGREIRIPKLPTGFVEHFAERQPDELQMRSQPLEVRRGQIGEKVVLVTAGF